MEDVVRFFLPIQESIKSQIQNILLHQNPMLHLNFLDDKNQNDKPVYLTKVMSSSSSLITFSNTLMNLNHLL